MEHEGILVVFYTFFDYIFNFLVRIRACVRLKGLFQFAVPSWEIG